MLFKAKGRLLFNPEDITSKHIDQSAWKRVAMIVFDCDVHNYYAWFIQKRFSLALNKNLRGAHVTFISDRVDNDLFNEVATKYNDMEVEFFYSIEPFTNGKHWWLRVFCLDIEPIREELNLDKYPYFGLHLTLGRVYQNNLESGTYIQDVCKRYNLLETNPRKPLDEYIIVNK